MTDRRPVPASDMFLIGDGVRGGPPSLTDLDDGDLEYTVDLRDVYATLPSGVLATDPGRPISTSGGYG